MLALDVEGFAARPRRYADALVADLAPEEFAVAAARGHGMAAHEVTRRARELLVPVG